MAHTMVVISVVSIVAAGLLFGFRLLRGPTLADRVNALNGLLIVASNAVAIHAMESSQGALVPVVVLAALVGFVGTAMVARFLEGRAG
jgi:multisubunit Na+/H+ antiporter MnhF subunit